MKYKHLIQSANRKKSGHQHLIEAEEIEISLNTGCQRLREFIRASHNPGDECLHKMKEILMVISVLWSLLSQQNPRQS
ncbi:hypothetical protein QQF64_013521 [Cirrhinus molitorella]|uniref:Uncharacterized protein n=1 Tax=Cirrhinus molitorella TaxID=172907 RepID=A0ABR3LT15_9TELE